MFCMTTWSAPGATHRALIVHGGLDIGASWYKVAEGLCKAGYTVDAPDHIGHGFSERSSPSYTTRSLAEFIDNNTSGTQYDVICGHSLGAIVAVDLFKLKNPKPARLVLLEPPIQSPYSMPQMMDFVKDILKDVPVEEVIRQRYPPSHTAFDIAITRVAWMRAEWEVMRGIFTENDLSIDISSFPSADESGSCQITILAGDPSAQSMFSLDTVPEFREKRGHIRVAMVRGSGHDMHKEASQVVADVVSGKALDEVQGLEVKL